MSGRTKRDWGAMPAEILAGVFKLTGDNPLRYAGVCKGWRRALDEPVFRHKLSLVHPRPTTPPIVQKRLLSLATFVCARPPVTRRLEVRLTDETAKKYVLAALAPVLTHLKSTLQELELEPMAASDAYILSPAVQLCRELRRLHLDARESLDVRHLRSLDTVELYLSTDTAHRVLLPDSVRSFTVGTSGYVPEQVMRDIVGGLSQLTRLDTLRLDMMDGEVDFRCSALPASLHTLELVGDFRVMLDEGARIGPHLRAFCLQYCRVSAPELAAFLEGCPSLRGLELARMTWQGNPVTCDLRRAPLSVVALLGAPKVHVPATVRKASLGAQDLAAFLEQPTAVSVEELVLDLDRLLSLRDVWPASLQLPRLRSVGFLASSLQAAAQLGQRCPRADVRSLTYVGRLELSTVQDLRDRRLL